MTNKIPLIFIPGLFGSMSSEIIPGTGSWHFGPSHYTGKRFIKILENHGYTTGEDLFVMSYDWRKPCSFACDTTLIPLIKKVRALTQCPYVNIICHGTGGLIARNYAQSDSYDSNIQNLILIGTPNAGFISAFSFYTGGILPVSCSKEPDFISYNIYTYLHLIKDAYTPITSTCSKHFSSLGDFIPSKDYGDFLFYTCRGTDYTIPRQYMTTTSPFLDKLTKTSHRLQERQIHVILIAGSEEPTLERLEVMPACTRSLWHDGKVINCVKSPDGDGCTLTRSVFAIEGLKYTLRADYGELLLQTATILPSLLHA